MRTAKTLSILGGRPVWSESSLGAHVILLLLSRGGSFVGSPESRRTIIKLFNIILLIMISPMAQKVQMRRLMTKPTKWLGPVKTPPSLIRVFAVRMKKVWVLSYPLNSDQTGRMPRLIWVMPRLIWVFAGRTCHFVCFVMRRLNIDGHTLR